MDLTARMQDVTSQRIDLDHGGFAEYFAGWLTDVEATALMERLLAELQWEAREIVLWGRRMLQPRLIAWAGSVPYRYSGQTLEPRDFRAGLGELLARVDAFIGLVCGRRPAGGLTGAVNHALVNRYRDGHDSMGFHADDEPELGENPVLAAVSLGAARRFVIASRRKPKATRTLILEHGSLLVMGGAMQHHYRHGVPKEPAVVGERINVTFRRLLRPPT